jgi:hypothetical protein
MGDARIAFLFKKLQEAPFPPGSTDDFLSEVHSDLAELDGFVAGLASQQAANPAQSEAALEGIRRLRTSLEGATARDSESAETIRNMVARVQLLDQVMQALGSPS